MVTGLQIYSMSTAQGLRFCIQRSGAPDICGSLCLKDFEHPLKLLPPPRLHIQLASDRRKVEDSQLPAFKASPHVTRWKHLSTTFPPGM